MNLQLAESGLRYSPYVWIPNIQQGGGVYCREDKFDTLSEAEYEDLMDELAPYEIDAEGLSEDDYLSNRADRKARRAERKQRKTERREAKKEKRAAKTEIKKARAEKIRAKGQAKIIKAEGKAANGGEDKNMDTATSWMENITGAASNIFGKGDGGEAYEVAPAKNNTIYWVVGGLAAAGLLYVVLKPKKAA